MKFIFLVLCFISTAALAVNEPRPGQYDRRVKYVDYNPADVIKLVAQFGYQIDIVLQEGEVVIPKGVYMGDSEAWAFATLNNHVFVKPKEEQGTTNMTLLTNRRSYSFELSSANWASNAKSNEMIFQVNIRYPQDEATKIATAQAQQKQAHEQAIEKEMLNIKMSRNESIKNWNYWTCGSEALAPDSAYDDGRFTHLTFKGNRDIPAIFIVNEDKTESLINRHVEGDEVIIQVLAPKLVLRKGKSVACVTNESFDPIGNNNKSGTTIPGVERVIKGEAP